LTWGRAKGKKKAIRAKEWEKKTEKERGHRRKGTATQSPYRFYNKATERDHMGGVSDRAAELLADHGEWMAALARLVLQALRAQDAKAVEAALFYLCCHVRNVLSRHLSKDPRWDSKGRWLDYLQEGAPDTALAGHFRLRDKMVWATADQQHWYREPFELDLELCPVTGAFRRYTMRFGDNRPLAENAMPSPTESKPAAARADHGWLFVFQAEKLENGSVSK
jgi:hypothetical protein